jgi:hypothetical protein
MICSTTVHICTICIGFEPCNCCQHFGDNLINHIAKTNWAVLSDRLRIVNLWDKNHSSIIPSLEDNTCIHSLKNFISAFIWFILLQVFAKKKNPLYYRATAASSWHRFSPSLPGAQPGQVSPPFPLFLSNTNPLCVHWRWGHEESHIALHNRHQGHRQSGAVEVRLPIAARPFPRRLPCHCGELEVKPGVVVLFLPREKSRLPRSSRMTGSGAAAAHASPHAYLPR